MILVHGLGLAEGVLGWLLLLASATMFVGSLFVARRRLNPPARLSRGPWMRLPKSLMAFSLSVFVITLPSVGLLPEGLLAGAGGVILTLLLALLVTWGLAEMLVGMGWGGPMKHAFAGALHLAFHRRPERFSTRRGGEGRSTGLKALNLEDPEAPLGVEKPADFTWNQLLGFDACVQCGRCEAVCPAFAAGQPLNPKKLIQDMVVGLAGGSDAGYAGSPILTVPWASITARPMAPSCSGRQGAGRRRNAMVLYHLSGLRRGMSDDDRARRCHRRHAALSDAGTRPDPRQGAEVLDNLIATDNPGGFDPGAGCTGCRPRAAADVPAWRSRRAAVAG